MYIVCIGMALDTQELLAFEVHSVQEVSIFPASFLVSRVRTGYMLLLEYHG